MLDLFPGLLPTKDVLERFPAERVPLLVAEIKRLEREKRLHEHILHLEKFQLFSFIKTFVFAGVAVFCIVMAIGGLAQFGRWVRALDGLHLTTIFGKAFPQGGNISSQLAEVLTGFPLWDIHDAWRITLLALFVLLILNGIRMYGVWKEMAAFKLGLKEVEAEIAELQRWLRETR